MRALGDATPDLLYAKDRAGRLLYANPAALSLIGLPATELPGHAAAEWPRYEGDAEAIRAADHRVMDRGDTEKREEQVYDGCSGETRIWESTKTPLRDKRTGEVIGIVGISRDITEQRRAEQRLAESEARFHGMVDAIPAMTWEGDASGAITWTSDFLQRYCGVAAAWMKGTGWLCTVRPDELADVLGQWNEAMRTGKGYVRRRRLRRASDGAWRWHLARVDPIEGKDGAVTRWVGSFTDIHDLFEAQMATQEQEALLRLFIEHAPAAIAMFDQGMRYLAVSRRFLSDHGFDLEPALILGISHYTLFPEVPEAWREVHRRVLAGETLSASDDPFRRLDGHTESIRWEMLPWYRGDGSTGGALLFSEVVTERKLIETSLRENEARLSDLVETLNLGTFLTSDLNRTVRFWSKGCERLYGWSAEEVLGKSLPDLLRTVLPVPFDEISAALEREGEYTGDARQVTKGGRELTITYHSALRRTADGRPFEYLLAVTDVTSQRHAEARAANAERIQALGLLAGGIAHDFNNTLQAVEGEATLIERQSGDVAAVRRHVERLLDSIRRGASITHRLLAFGRPDDLSAEVLEVAPTLCSLREILTHTLGPAVDVELRLGPDLRPAFADRGQLETALVNLATNGRDAMPEGGRLVISADAEMVLAGGASHPAHLAPGGYVRLAVADTGGGMDAATLARAFEPFFTTKPAGVGTGLGLPMAKGFAERSGGALMVESSPGQGTTVTLWLPEAEMGGSGSRAVPGRPVDVTGGISKPVAGVRLLVADDEEAVLSSLAENLELENFKVTLARSGGEALDWLDAGNVMDVLVTDLSMPGMDGIALIQAVQERHRGLPALLVTGYAGDETAIAVSGAIAGPCCLLRKPVRIRDLVDRIHSLLAVSPA